MTTYTIRTKKDLCKMIQELIALQPQLTVQELTKGTTDLESAMVQVLTIGSELLNIKRPHQWYLDYVANVVELSFEYRVKAENKLSASTFMNEQEWATKLEGMSKEELEAFVMEIKNFLTLVDTVSGDYNGRPSHKTYAQHEKILVEVEAELNKR